VKTSLRSLTQILALTLLLTSWAAHAQTNGVSDAVAVAVPPASHHVRATVNAMTSFSKEGTPLTDEAKAQMQLVLTTLKEFPLKEDWNFVVICDDLLWKKFMDHVGNVADFRSQYYGVTSLATHTTYLRGSTLVHPNNPDVTPERVIAHEMAHIFLPNQIDERDVDALALQLIKKADSERASANLPTAGPLTAGTR